MQRSYFIDFVKGFSIIAIILYHCGLLPNGYLGVDIFLVVAGYLTTKSILGSLDRNDFTYKKFLENRLLRLCPLLLLVCAVSLLAGYFLMLPENFENTCETVVGTSGLFNNFVQYITSGNYWDQSNDYKPLMHTWYVGLIVQFYMVFPLVFILSRRYSHRVKDGYAYFLLLLFFISLACYILPGLSVAAKFYFLPARLFEFVSGGLVFLWGWNGNDERQRSLVKTIAIVSFVFLFLLLVTDFSIGDKQTRLLLVVFFSTLLLFLNTGYSFHVKHSFVVLLGKASYSLFLWHQVVLAFYRYVITPDFTTADYIISLTISLLIGLLSYKFIEQGIDSYLKRHASKNKAILLSCVCATVCLMGLSCWGYKLQGVVRDVPELDVAVSGMNVDPIEYNARNDAYNKDFVQNGKPNVLVIGDSFGRDWINVLRESEVGQMINISFYREPDSIAIRRVREANCVFIANNAPFDKYYKLLPYLSHKRFYRVGHKRFGKCIGNYYTHRRDSFYYKQTFKYDTALNEEEKKVFGANFIDIMQAIRNPDGTYPVFTQDHKFFSHDCIHLTKAGAKQIAHKLNVRELIGL